MTLQDINHYVKDIQNGTEDFFRFNLSEHAGLCTGGAPLIGASIIACYATASITASCDAEGRQGGPTNWEIDEQQETFIEQWAISDRLALEDMHPANVFIDVVTEMPIYISPSAMPSWERMRGMESTRCWYGND